MNKYKGLIMAGIATAIVGVGIAYRQSQQSANTSTDQRITAYDRGACSRLWSELDNAKAQVYFSEGFEFTPGGGYFYYPRGMEMTQEQRETIEKRLKKKLSVFEEREKRLESMCRY